MNRLSFSPPEIALPIALSNSLPYVFPLASLLLRASMSPAVSLRTGKGVALNPFLGVSLLNSFHIQRQITPVFSLDNVAHAAAAPCSLIVAAICANTVAVPVFAAACCGAKFAIQRLFPSLPPTTSATILPTLPPNCSYNLIENL
jgi:hypothetical protein